ncbi:MAG: tRNA (adenosine(37)-N6)-threonylcarbamoyltransferase complex ATPase subunit type 1 TsaE [Acidimicrobiales bacterium]
MLTARTTSAEETRALAAALAELARPGDLLLLVGDLGAGKTAFVQGFGRALGVAEPITSPTFTLHRQYVGRLELNHIDVYRLEQIEETLDIGLAELLDSGAVTVIEWGDAILPVLPAEFLEVRLILGEGDDERLVSLRPVGQRWTARGRALAAALAAWTADGSESSC